jgi:hypothetical protein
MTADDFNKTHKAREREYKAWSAGERDRLLNGPLNDLEAVIADERLHELSSTDRTTLIEGFVERCRKERAPQPNVSPLPPIRPRRAYRAPAPLAEATLPAAPATPDPQLSFARAIAWSIAHWTTAVGLGLGTLYLAQHQ